MTKDQIAACKKRCEQLKSDIGAGKALSQTETMKVCSDIEKLIADLAAATAQCRREHDAHYDVRQRLAEANRQKADCMRTVGPLRDKLSKARQILRQIAPADFTAQEKRDMKDILKDA